jgi:type IV fimbrial biogenesis protein FimT
LPFVAAPNAPVGWAAKAISALPIVQAMKRAPKGFTLLELMVALTVLSILLAVGVPSFRNIIRNNRIASGTNELVGALTYARSEAMKRGDTVTTCPTEDQEECSGSNDWATGWMVFVDLNRDGARDETELLLQVWQGLGGDLDLESSGQFLQYTSTGLTDPVISNADFELMMPGFEGEHARCIQVGNTGRIFTERNTCP